MTERWTRFYLVERAGEQDREGEWDREGQKDRVYGHIVTQLNPIDDTVGPTKDLFASKVQSTNSQNCIYFCAKLFHFVGTQFSEMLNYIMSRAILLLLFVIPIKFCRCRVETVGLFE